MGMRTIGVDLVAGGGTEGVSGMGRDSDQRYGY
jgi:hypothetical protein